MSDSDGKDILFLQLVVLFKMKEKKRRNRKIRIQELFRKYASGLWMSEKTFFERYLMIFNDNLAIFDDRNVHAGAKKLSP